MSYASWIASHAIKHRNIVEKLLASGMDKEEIIEYFVFENMVEHENDFCPLYAENKKCHDRQYLNCYLCACPHFRFDDTGLEIVDGKTKYSFCAIEAKDGVAGVYGDAIHQDCAKCSVPHTKAFVSKYFDLDWKLIMQKCFSSTKKD
ncbi:MAG: hypothetical protein RBR59_00270 [Sulfurimonadaceae bacterium]|jgi:hypothetical protein|nr:hypothetical protein [Sulfurimonadaceae bacterium]